MATPVKQFGCDYVHTQETVFYQDHSNFPGPVKYVGYRVASSDLTYAFARQPRWKFWCFGRRRFRTYAGPSADAPAWVKL